jgi:hypothetical protein
LTIPIELFILDYWIPVTLLSPSVACMIEQVNVPNHSVNVDNDHGVAQYVPQSGLLPRELDRFLKRHPRFTRAESCMPCIQAEHHACRASHVKARFVAIHYGDA